jgi:hypothetical protein
VAEFEEDLVVRDGLSVLPPEARAELERVLMWPPEKREQLLRQLVGRRDLEHLSTLIAMADSEEVRLRLLRALRDLE